jgi:hypothetical protein
VKKVLAIAASTAIMMGTMLISASAATTDLKPVEGLTNVYEHSEFQYENNQDLGITLYTRSKPGDQYLTFKADGTISSFEIGLQKCAGFYDPENITRDINFFVSSDNKNWTKVDVTEGPTTYNTDIYLSEKQAYWWNSKVTSKSISGSPSYLKIVVKDSPVSGAPSWNLAIDSIKLTTAAANNGTTTAKNNSSTTTAKNNSGSTTTKSGGTSSPTTGENTLPVASMIAVSVMSVGALMVVKSKKRSK